MAKHIEVEGANNNPVYIPSEDLMKIVADDTSNTCVFTYISGETVTGGIALTNAAEARALEASLSAIWLKCINAGPDAAGVIVSNTVFVSVS